MKGLTLAFVLVVAMTVFWSIRCSAEAIIHGPYLIDMTETEVTIIWVTDVVSTGKVEYGTGGVFTNSIIEVNNMLANVGKVHSVRLTGLQPGVTYDYRVVSRHIIYLGDYYYDTPIDYPAGWLTRLGGVIVGDTHEFTTMNRDKPEFTFWFLADAHAFLPRMDALLNLVDYNDCDFVAYGGDMAVANGVLNMTYIWNIIDPSVDKFATMKPFLYAWGNHELRGPYSRILDDYLPISTGTHYHVFNHGPASIAVIDTADADVDGDPRNADLIHPAQYRAEQFDWLVGKFSESTWQDSPIKIMIGHIPDFSVNTDKQQWFELANGSGIQLMLGGHYHVYAHMRPARYGFHTVMIGQDQIAKIKVTSCQIQVTVYKDTGVIVDEFDIPTDVFL